MTDEERARHRATLRRVQLGGHVISTVFECVVLAEILWYYLHDGEQTLHEAVAEWWQEFRERAREAYRVEQTRNMIRDLPEADATEET